MLFEGWFHEDDEGESSLNTYDYTVLFNFENGTMNADEMWGVENGRVWSSSDRAGVMGWAEDECQYISHIYCRETKLGAFISAEFTLDEALREALSELS